MGSRRAVLLAGLCGLRGGLASAERMQTEVDHVSQSVFLKKVHGEEVEDPEAQRARALRSALSHVTVLGAAQLVHRLGNRQREKSGPDAALVMLQDVERDNSRLVWALASLAVGVAVGGVASRRRHPRKAMPAEAITSLEEARASLERLEASLEQAQAQSEQLQAENDALRQMHRDGLSSASTLTPKEEPLEESFVDVFLRIRPTLKVGNSVESCLSVEDNEVHVDDGQSEHQFGFRGIIDSTFGEDGQEEAYEMIGAKAVQSVLDGYHTCVFGLGQTGTGKTHTLIGTAEDPGLLPRMVSKLLQSPQHCRLSCVELYMDKLRDLLADDSGDRPPLDIRGDTGAFYISNLGSVSLEDPQTAIKLIRSAAKNRMTARTSMNANSSRGHVIYQLEFGSGAKLCVVDLAGRENERSTGCRGQNLLELGYINKSLFHLKSVLQALAGCRQRGLVPFRDSKLTMLLSECLQGARTLLVATVSPDSIMVDETLTTCKLAQAVRQITMRSRKNTNSPAESPSPRDTVNRGNLTARKLSMSSQISADRVQRTASAGNHWPEPSPRPRTSPDEVRHAASDGSLRPGASPRQRQDWTMQQLSLIRNEFGISA